MWTRTGGIAGPVRLALIGLLCAALAVPALAQPDPAPRAQVETSYVNISQAPEFKLTVAMPMVFHFSAKNIKGQTFLRVIAEIPLDELQARATAASNYLDRHESLFTPLIDSPPNGPPNAYRALRDLLPARRLSYHRRLSDA